MSIKSKQTKEVMKNIPERLQSRKEIIEEMIKHPENRDLVYRLLRKKDERALLI